MADDRIRFLPAEARVTDPKEGRDLSCNEFCRYMEDVADNLLKALGAQGSIPTGRIRRALWDLFDEAIPRPRVIKRYFGLDEKPVETCPDCGCDLRAEGAILIHFFERGFVGRTELEARILPDGRTDPDYSNDRDAVAILCARCECDLEIMGIKVVIDPES